MRKPGSVRMWSRGLNWYKELRRRHRLLWEFVPKWLAENDVDNLLEIGGGDGYVATLLPPGASYTNIELNVQESLRVVAPKRVKCSWAYGDFMAMDLTPFVGKHDAVLALAVIEHNESATAFLDRIVELQAPLALVSFFRGLDREADTIVKAVPERGAYWENSYARKTITDHLGSRGVAFSIQRVGQDELLTVYPLAGGGQS